VQHLAAHFFTQLVLSAWGKTICKCRYERCGKYFQIEKPRAVYKWGTRHRVCSNKASAIRKFHQDRKTMQATKLDLTCKAVLNLKAKPKTDRKELKHKIVAQMNRQLHRDARVTVKWVTRHWKKITVVKQENTIQGKPHK
jgi:hypothetical protein